VGVWLVIPHFSIILPATFPPELFTSAVGPSICVFCPERKPDKAKYTQRVIYSSQTWRNTSPLRIINPMGITASLHFSDVWRLSVIKFCEAEMKESFKNSTKQGKCKIVYVLN
jgi:hypothetical protein